jgi:DNA-binding XRE family transcriptional regulator
MLSLAMTAAKRKGKPHAVEALKELRAYLGITQEGMGKRLQCHWVTVQAHEAGRKALTPKILEALTEVAMAEGRPDLAKVFVAAFRACWSPLMTENSQQDQASPEEAKYSALFRDVLRREPELAKPLTAWLDLFEKRRA